METEKWSEELNLLRTLIQQTDLEETRKWGGEVYVYQNHNVLMLGAFKTYVGIWFYDGVFLKDPQNVLQNAQDGKTKAMRSWRFSSMEDIDPKLVTAYIQEAIQNAKDGKKWVPEKNQPLEIPELLQQELEQDEEFKVAFERLSPYKQKEYCEHIQMAKRDATKASRLEKMKPLIMEGKGLHDKYK